MPAVQNVSIQRASDLPPAMRSAVEQLLGRPVAPDEEISVIAMPPQPVPPLESRAAVARDLEALLNRRADKVERVPEEEIDAAIDEALHAVRHDRE
jgi:predicted component of type VI protein secretion system